MVYSQGLRDLIALLRAEGVERFRDGDLEIHLAHIATPEPAAKPDAVAMAQAGDAERRYHDDILFAAVGGAPEEVKP